MNFVYLSLCLLCGFQESIYINCSFPPSHRSNQSYRVLMTTLTLEQVWIFQGCQVNNA